MTMSAPARPWWSEVSRYQWFVFAVAGGSWLFDNMDQRLFSLVRIPALAGLMQLPGDDLAVQAAAKTTTSLFLLGWGIGGVTIGALGDRYGRVRLLTISVLMYSICTGLTALCRTQWDFAALRLLTGIGIGGVFGLAVTIIAETTSGAARLAMLALLQVVSTAGNVAAAFIKMAVDSLANAGVIASTDSWRWLFAIGAAPALLAVIGGIGIRESDAWLHLKNTGQLPQRMFGSYAQLLANRTERRNLIIGTWLAVAGVVGLWGIGEYAVDLQDMVFTAHFSAMHPPEDVRALVAQAKNWSFLLQMTGGALGMIAFTYIVNHVGRRPAFMAGFASALLITLYVYWKLETPSDAYWMMPLMGAAQFSLFAGYSIYLPELFGPRARSTGVSFAYNLGRFAAAGGSLASALLTTHLFGNFAPPAPLRYAAMTMCTVFVIGFIAALYAPETKGKDLP